MSFNIIKSYSGYYYNDQKLLESASGGAATAFAEAIIKRNGIVFGVGYSSNFRHAEYKCIEKLENLYQIKGSKYCETRKEIDINGKYESLYKVLENKLTQEKMILFFGLGCDIAAVKSFCRNKQLDTSKLYCIEILCHGPTLYSVHEQYVNHLETKYRSNLISFNLRYKKLGWSPNYIQAIFENGEQYEIPFFDSDYGKAFANYSKKACYNCKFRGEFHPGDITIGDHWGISKDMKEWNKNGVSIIFVQTFKGFDLIDLLGKDFKLSETDTDFALQNNPMYFCCRKEPKDYTKFVLNLNTKGLHYAVKHIKLGFKERVRCLFSFLQ